jgi:hypothetical protein
MWIDELFTSRPFVSRPDLERASGWWFRATPRDRELLVLEAEVLVDEDETTRAITTPWDWIPLGVKAALIQTLRRRGRV